MTILARYPFARQTSASAGPVLPPVYSTTVVPGSIEPSRSAPSIIDSAIRSFIEPVGFKYSSLTQSSAPFSGASRRSRTSGVFPIVARIASPGTAADYPTSPGLRLRGACVRIWRGVGTDACASGRYVVADGDGTPAREEGDAVGRGRPRRPRHAPAAGRREAVRDHGRAA